MNRIGETNTATPEFTIYKMRAPYTRNIAFLVELDGQKLDGFGHLAEAHKAIKAEAKENILKGAGVTEVFGRNRRFIITNRFGFKPFKGE